MKFNFILLLFHIGLILKANAQQANDPCASAGPYHIVVIGSSTAAGAGASTPDSAWVNRYRSALQALNPGNTVTNLAVGGYNTYKLMPTGFVQPSGRPSADTLRNISSAIALNPDAIIMNLPSNDVAAGFTLAEQIFNMDSINATSQQAGIPIWICTTQPRNFSNSTQLQKQMDMRDSIIDHFAPFVLDFWTGLALPNGSMDPFYNSGDGVHLNDFGHALLARRTLDKNLIGFLYQPVNFNDFKVLAVENLFDTECGDNQGITQVTYGNLGIQDNVGGRLFIRIEHPSFGMIAFDSLIFLPGTASCASDTASFNWPSSLPGEYNIKSWVNHPNDSNGSNDSLQMSIETIGIPALQLKGDTLCDIGIAQLEALTLSTDTIFWYKDAQNDSIIGQGSVFNIPNLDKDTTIYVQGVRGPLYFQEELQTSTSSNIDWNGTMFDLMAHAAISIDSFSMKVADAGTHVVEIRIKTGSYVGFEGIAAPWTLIATDTVNVSSGGDLVFVSFPAINLNMDDTIGVYLQMANPGVRLSYRNNVPVLTRSTNELSIQTGSGISHNFSASFFPRDWNGSVFYHYGFNPEGTCASDRIPVKAYFSDQVFDIGSAINIPLNDSVLVSVPAGFHNPLWYDGDTSQQKWLIADDFGSGSFSLPIEVSDSLNCRKFDTLELNISLLAIDESMRQTKIWPNPTKERIQISTEQIWEQWTLINVQGKHLLTGKHTPRNIDLKHYKSGVYRLGWQSRGIKGQRLIIKE